MLSVCQAVDLNKTPKCRVKQSRYLNGPQHLAKIKTSIQQPKVNILFGHINFGPPNRNRNNFFTYTSEDGLKCYLMGLYLIIS